MIGKGRKFNKEGFDIKLEQIDYFMLCDINKFPKITIFSIHKDNNIIQKKKINYKNFLQFKKQNIKDIININLSNSFTNFFQILMI